MAENNYHAIKGYPGYYIGDDKQIINSEGDRIIPSRVGGKSYVTLWVEDYSSFVNIDSLERRYSGTNTVREDLEDDGLYYHIPEIDGVMITTRGHLVHEITGEEVTPHRKNRVGLDLYLLSSHGKKFVRTISELLDRAFGPAPV